MFLDNHEIASAQASTASKVVEFDFTDGMELKFTEERIGVIMFNSFQVLNQVLPNILAMSVPVE